jgi:hypothetical protein
MDPVTGEGVILKFNYGVSLVPFGCARSITFNMTADTIGKSTIGSGNWKEYEVVVKGWDFTIEGLIYLDMTGVLITPTVYDFWNAMEPITIEFLVTNGTTEVQYSGEALITNVSTNGNVNNNSSLNITGLGTGELLLSTGLIMDSDEIDIMDSDSVLITDLT